MTQHYHVCSESPLGEEYINALWHDKHEAAFAFLQVVRKIMQQTPAYRALNIETVVNSLDEADSGVFVVSRPIFLKIYRCESTCFSPSWN